MKINYLKTTFTKEFIVREERNIQRALTWARRESKQQAQTPLYNLSHFTQNNRDKGQLSIWWTLHIVIKSKEPVNLDPIAEYRHYHYKTGSGLHVIIPLEKQHTWQEWETKNQAIKRLIRSWGILGVDYSRCSPAQWHFVPSSPISAVPGVRKLTLDDLPTQPAHNPGLQLAPQADNLKAIVGKLVERHTSAWTNSHLYPFVQSCKNEGLKKDFVEDCWEKLKEPSYQGSFSDHWNSTSFSYRYPWLYQQAGEETPAMDLEGIIKQYDIYSDTSSGIYTIVREAQGWRPQTVSKNNIMDLINEQSDEQYKREVLNRKLVLMGRNFIKSNTDLYREHLIERIDGEPSELFFMLVQNLCDNGDGNAKLVEKKKDFLYRCLWQVLFGDEDKIYRLPSPCFYGAGGAGKSLFTEIFNTIYDSEYAVAEEDTNSAFNGHIQFAKIITYQESAKKKIDMDRIKRVMLQPTIQINDKGKCIRPIKNAFWRIFTSNEWMSGLNTREDTGWTRRWSFFRVKYSLSKKHPEVPNYAWGEIIRNRKEVGKWVNWIAKNYKDKQEEIHPVHDDYDVIREATLTDLEVIAQGLYDDFDAISSSVLTEIVRAELGPSYTRKSREIFHSIYQNKGITTQNRFRSNKVPYFENGVFFMEKLENKQPHEVQCLKELPQNMQEWLTQYRDGEDR